MHAFRTRNNNDNFRYKLKNNTIISNLTYSIIHIVGLLLSKFRDPYGNKKCTYIYIYILLTLYLVRGIHIFFFFFSPSYIQLSRAMPARVCTRATFLCKFFF